MSSQLSVRGRLVFGVLHVTVASLVATAVFFGLPTRDWSVDVPVAILFGMHLVSAFALLRLPPWARLAVATTTIATAGAGALAILALAGSIAWLSGIHGALGQGGMAIFGVIIALLVPYSIVLPLVELRWMIRSRRET